MALLDVQNLTIAIATQHGLHEVVRNVSFSLEAGQTLGLVGESGCGKSITSLVLMGLTEGSQIRIVAGQVWFDGQELLSLDARQRRALMGNRLAMIFQEPMTSLNPVYKVGDQIVEAVLQHQSVSKLKAMHRAAELLAQVGIPEARKRLQSYPHQLSGGMRQRVMIAMALACNPVLLIADEPTTALDVTIQAQILSLLKQLQADTGMAMILISHDLGVIANVANHTAVMYRGEIVETGVTKTLFDAPGHPYTEGLLASLPDPDNAVTELTSIPGRVPMLGESLPGCQFHPRCSHVQLTCHTEAAPQQEFNTGTVAHKVLCHYPLIATTGANP